MTRYRDDIPYGYDDMSHVGYWTPDTPDFLEKRDERRARSRQFSTSYTEAKANIRRVSMQNQAESAARHTPSGQAQKQASIIDFEQIGRARTGAGGRVSLEGKTARGGGVRFEAELCREPKGVTGSRAVDSRSGSRLSGNGRAVDRGYEAQPRYDLGLRQADSVYDRPYRPGYAFDEALPESEAPENHAGSSLRDKLQRARHDWRSRKADRAYTRSYDDEPPSPAAGPRAAVYRGQMGRAHQRAARMQDAARPGARFQMPAFLGRIFDALPSRLPVRPGFVYSALVLACVAFVAFSVFPAAQDYYVQSRVNDQLVAEYQAVLSRNQELEQHVAALQTDEGIEQLAHESLGWVKDGENAVSVVTDGSADPGSDSLSETGAVVEGSVPTPETWYSPVLDVVFGYEG